MNGGDFFALSSEALLNNLGGEIAPPSGHFCSMPIFPGVGLGPTWLLGPSEEHSHQKNSPSVELHLR